MTTTAQPSGITSDRLADPLSRRIATVWETSLTKGDGRVQVVIQTRWAPSHKALLTDIHLRSMTPDGFARREFELIGPPNAQRGISLGTLPLPRFSQATARREHLTALTFADVVVKNNAIADDAGAEIAAAWAARV